MRNIFFWRITNVKKKKHVFKKLKLVKVHKKLRDKRNDTIRKHFSALEFFDLPFFTSFRLRQTRPNRTTSKKHQQWQIKEIMIWEVNLDWFRSNLWRKMRQTAWKNWSGRESRKLLTSFVVPGFNQFHDSSTNFWLKKTATESIFTRKLDSMNSCSQDCTSEVTLPSVTSTQPLKASVHFQLR